MPKLKNKEQKRRKIKTEPKVIPERVAGSGFDRIEPGEHLCGFYQDADEKFSILTQFFRAGLQNHEKCIYILDESSKEEVIQAFNKAGVDLKKHLRSKQFELLSSEETYLHGGYFDPDRMVELLKQNENKAIKEGYHGLRISGEMTWALKKPTGAERLVEYEAKLNYYFPKSKVSAICLYNEKKFDQKTLLEIIYTHPKIIMQGSIYENHIYIPPADFLPMRSGNITRELVENVKMNIIRMAEQRRKRELAELELKRSEERYRTLVETMNDGLAYVDENGVIQYVNQKYCEMMGVSREEVIGRRVTDFLDDENRKIFEENFKKALRGERCVYELVRLRKDGGKVYTLTSSAPLLIEGKVKGTFAVITDITDLKRTESKLRESELKYSTIVEKGPEGVVIIQDGIIKFVNRRLSEITGIKVEEYLGSSYLNFIAPEYQELAAERYTKRMSGVKVPDRYEIELIGRDGRRIPFEIIATVIDYEGRPADMVILRDITERRKADQMLRESEEKYRSLVESSSDSIYMLDRDLRYIQVNQELLKRLGLPQEKVVGKTFGELHSAEETREFEAKAREVFETGKVVQQEHYHARLGRYFLRTISPVRDPKSGEIKAIIVVGKDITELKQALENLKKSEEEYRSLAENVADILLRIDLNGNCTYVSKSAFEETGYTIEDAKKLNIKDILTPESYETALARIKMWKSGTRKLPPWVAEIKSKDGRIVPYELKTSPIFENGKLSGIQIIARNVSERIAAMQAIEHARAYAESIVEAVHEPLVVLDADMKVISANRAFYECFQVTPEETEKYSLYELGNKQWDIPELRKLLNDVVEKNISFKEYVVVHDFPRIGRKIMMLNAKQMRTKEGGKPMVLLAIEDITERHLMETQLRRSSEIQSAIVSLLSLPLNYSMEEILKRALKTILSLSWLNLEQRGSIFLADDEQNTLVLKTQHKVPEILQTCSTVPFGRCLCGRAAATKKIIFTDHVDENHETKYEGIRPHGHYCVPILTDDKVVGVIDLYIQEGHRQDEAEMEFLKAAANALALIITRKNFELEQLKFIYRINEISKGECYLYRSHRAAYNIASHLMLLGVPGICFTREDPEKLIEYRIPKENIIIISSVPLKGYDTTDNLQEISMRIGEFIRNNRGSIVLLDGLEYLVSRFGFDMTYKFLQEKRFQFIENDAILLMPVELNIFSEREKALFASEVKIIG